MDNDNKFIKKKIFKKTLYIHLNQILFIQIIIYKDVILFLNLKQILNCQK